MPASAPTCHHLHPAGNRCGSPALRGERFCFYHHPTRRPPTRVAPSRTSFGLPPITNPKALQIALSDVMCRLADNTLDVKRAGLLLLTLQMAKANLSELPAYSSPGPARAPLGSPDLPDLSRLLAELGLQPNLAAPKR